MLTKLRIGQVYHIKDYNTLYKEINKYGRHSMTK